MVSIFTGSLISSGNVPQRQALLAQGGRPLVFGDVGLEKWGCLVPALIKLLLIDEMEPGKPCVRVWFGIGRFREVWREPEYACEQDGAKLEAEGSSIVRCRHVHSFLERGAQIPSVLP